MWRSFIRSKGDPFPKSYMLTFLPSKMIIGQLWIQFSSFLPPFSHLLSVFPLQRGVSYFTQWGGSPSNPISMYDHDPFSVLKRGFWLVGFHAWVFITFILMKLWWKTANKQKKETKLRTRQKIKAPERMSQIFVTDFHRAKKNMQARQLKLKLKLMRFYLLNIQ